MNKKLISDVIDHNFEDCISGSIDDVIDYLKSLKVYHDNSKKYSSLEIQSSDNYEQSSLKLIGYRLETDVEYNHRMIREEKIKLQKIKRLRKLSEKINKELNELK